MNVAQKLLVVVGSVFAGVGGIIMLGFIWLSEDLGDTKGFLIIPLPFLLLGLGLIAGVLISMAGKRRVVRHGEKYAAKIYGYVENTAYRVNGCYTLNTQVRYFDKNHIKRQAILRTGFMRGADTYPIGMTIDIYEYQGKYSYDKASVRSDIIPEEQELMQG